MLLDPGSFIKLNVADTCSIWNIISSSALLSAAKSANCTFCCTAFVHYECFDKPRRSISQPEEELQALLKREQSGGQFSVYHLDLEDLLDVEVLRERMNLGKGELSSIAFARRTRQGFITDDQGARRLAETALPGNHVQTTPHLFGWLIYERYLTDGDKDKVIEQHTTLGRPLGKYFEIMYERALERRLMKTHA
jgi:hypothetical protein